MCLSTVMGFFDPNREAILCNYLFSLMLSETCLKFEITSLFSCLPLLWLNWSAVWLFPASSGLFEEIPTCFVAETRPQTQTLPEDSFGQTWVATSNGISIKQRPRTFMQQTFGKNVHDKYYIKLDFFLQCFPNPLQTTNILLFTPFSHNTLLLKRK